MKPRIFDTAADLFQAAAEEFSNRADRAIKDHGRFCVALSGGSTPKALFSLLASGRFPDPPWDKTFLFWGDERYVPSDAAESNFRMTKESLLAKVPIPAENVFRIKTEISPADLAAADYEQTLKTFFNLKPGELPRFDLTLNGIGVEGHTASLFPDSPALEETTRLVLAPWIEKFKMPAEDAIALLGGRENDLFRRVRICYLEKDPAKRPPNACEALRTLPTIAQCGNDPSRTTGSIFRITTRKLPKI